MNVLASVAAAVVMMLIFWQGFDPRVIIVLVIALAISEIFIKVRWRLSVVCRQCGFDPVLYTKNPEQVAQMVKEKLDLRKQDPKYLLAKPIQLPAISAQKAEALQKKEKGSLVSRSI